MRQERNTFISTGNEAFPNIFFYNSDPPTPPMSHFFWRRDQWSLESRERMSYLDVNLLLRCQRSLPLVCLPALLSTDPHPEMNLYNMARDIGPAHRLRAPSPRAGSSLTILVSVTVHSEVSPDDRGRGLQG